MIQMRTGWLVAAIWACLAARLAFYSAAVPMWEGVDEWAHFAVVQDVALKGELLASRDHPIPRNIEASLGLVPLPWELRRFSAPAVTHDAWWQLSGEDRLRRRQALLNLRPAWALEKGSGAFSNYEAQQPPLYYWTMAPCLWLMRGCSLPAQVLALRWWSALLASLVAPLVFAIARELFADRRMALGSAAVVAVMPGFAWAVARVGNDSVAAPLYAALIWACLRLWRKPAAWVFCEVGIFLGLGLLTKAYFLTALVPVAFVIFRARGKRLLGWRLCGVALPALLAGWWYLRNLVTTGTLSGLGESVALEKSDPSAILRVAPSIPWWRAIDAILFSHIYCGGWSWLTVRSWMYHLFYVVLALAAIGLWRWRRHPGIRWLLALYLFFWLGELWHAALLFRSYGVPASMGWYLYGIVSAEAPLAVAGLATWIRRWAAPALVGLFALLDIAAMHLLALPYNAGIIRHQADGALHMAHLTNIQISAIAEHLSTLVAEPLWTLLWVCYLIGTATCVLLVSHHK
jgi:4-amino-4-deoxy-L-arabinose transferase-like glycosyltransferase